MSSIIMGRWEEEKYINQGGYSEVYRVKSHGKYYALKKIFPSKVKNPMIRQSLERQIKIMETLDHPRIIKLYEATVDDDEISLLLEYAEGGSLYDQLKNYGKLPEHQVKQYVKDLIEALEYLHSRKVPILHRDIKPQNLLIGEDRHCRLADFGAANIMDGQRMSYVGTEDYMAPEVVQRQPHGVPYDVWCVGILIYQLLTGEVWKEGIQYPAYLSRASEDVIKKLLVKQQHKRMTLAQLRQHIWLCDDNRRIRKLSSSKRVNKLEDLKRRVKRRLKQEASIYQNKTTEENSFKKQKSVMEENEELNGKSNEYILLLKERQKLKQQIMKNEKIIQKEQRRRRGERPGLLQEIDRLKCQIKEYQNNINILKARPIKKEAECRNSIQQLGKKIQELTEFVSKLPQRIKGDLLYFSDYEAEVEVFPLSEYVIKFKSEMLINLRDGLIQLIAAKKTNREIEEMIQIHNQFHMSETQSQKESSTHSELMASNSDLMGGKQKTL